MRIIETIDRKTIQYLVGSSNMKKSHGVIIREAYKDYSPPIRTQRTVDLLLNGIPKKRLNGLHTIVITNSANLSHDTRRGKIKSQGRKVHIVHSNGFYYGKRLGDPAWIQLLLDNILEPWPKCVLRIPFMRDLAVSDTLFHELGHHIHTTQEPQHKEPEGVADTWRKRLQGYYFRRRYWYLMPLFAVLWVILRPIYWIIKKHKKKKP